jgi:CheY-like chemotaxis protein
VTTDTAWTGPSTPTTQLRILWAEDNPDDIQGFMDYLENEGDIITPVRDFESTLDALQSQSFDVFFADQQLLKSGQPAHNAGCELVHLLKSGALGKRNIDIAYGFITASDEWVLDSPIPGIDYPNYLGIGEKADDVATWMDERLPELREHKARLVAPPPPQELVDKPREETTGGPSVEEDSSTGLSMCESWIGVITGVSADGLRVRLTDPTGASPDYEALLPARVLAPRERHLVSVGAQLQWSLRIDDGEDGQRTVVSRFQLLASDRLTAADVNAALARARARRAARAPLDEGV